MNIVSFLSASDMKISDAALYALVGFIIVLAVLALLVGIFYLTGFLFQTKALSKQNLFERKKKSKTSDDVNSDIDADAETIAAITAAIYSIYADEADADNGNVTPEFVIRRVKKK